MKLRLVIVNILCLTFFLANAQNNSNLHRKIVKLNADTLQLDTNSLVPGSISIYVSDSQKLSLDFVKIQYATGYLIFDTTKFQERNLAIYYRIFPIEYFQKVDLDFFRNNQTNDLKYNSTIFPIKQPEQEKETLYKKGTISRGISVGNNQNMSVASNLNLQLSGKLNEDFEIKASITDNNIPVQPDGNTQQIQDFDKIFIELIHKKGKLTAGDFEMKSPNSQFLKYFKKVQGAALETNILLKDSTLQIKSYSGAALSKGKYNRFKIVPIEGNQGPYKLQGANNESYIIVIAGTEKVYVDGKQLTRGFSNDYIIDYNTAELTFTPNFLITKDKRIDIEFEYTDRNYARVTANAGIELNSEKWTFATNIFIENDLKNQSIDQILSSKQKSFLEQLGDSIQNSVSYRIDSVNYSNDKVLYKMVDSLGYDSVFVYSTQPDSAHYQLSFSFVGVGKGNYNQIKSAANGKVFEWIAPESGQPQGSYEPVIMLVTPKKNQMYSFKTLYKPNNKTEIFTEIAISNKDYNLFSDLNDQDNTGIAAIAGFRKKFNFKIHTYEWILKTDYNYQYQQRDFEIIEHYRPIEFLRDWNLKAEPVKKDQHLNTFNLILSNKKRGNLSYTFSSFMMKDYTGIRHASHFSFNPLITTNFNGDFSLTKSDYSVYKADFLKHRIGVCQNLPFMTIELSEESENNTFIAKPDNTWLNNSLAFTKLSAQIQNTDSLKNKFKILYTHRIDYLNHQNAFEKSSTANELETQLQILTLKSNTVRMSFTIRNLQINDTIFNHLKPEISSLGKIEHNLNVYKSAISAVSFFQAGSGMEVKKDFSYLEVAPGQGIYAWNDYNQNGVRELDEFEISAFQDKANFIRVFIPTNEYVKTYTNSFSSVINLNPSRIFRSDDKKLKKLISRFSNQFIYKVDNKNTFQKAEEAYNPFFANVNSNNILSLNTQHRNVLYFNKSNPIFSGDISYKSQKYKTLLTNGSDKSDLNQTEIRIRWSFLPSWQYRIELTKGIKNFNSEYFINKNYEIDFRQMSNEWVFQPGKIFRITFQYEFRFKENIQNTILPEKSIQHIFGLESKYNFTKNGSVNGRFSYLNLSYNASANTQISYEMLMGLLPGNNLTWNFNYQRILLNNLQLSLVYEGRKSESSSIIHVGSVQLRAYF